MKKYLCVITLALLFVKSIQSQECYPTPAGIVGWWMGEGDALDAISGSNGVVHSGTTFTAGMVGEAFSFDGGTGCVMNDQTAPLTDIQNTFTIEFWAYPQKGINLPPQDGSGYPGISGQSYAIFPNFGGYDGKAGAGVSLGTNGISVIEHAHNYMASVLSYTNAINGWVHVAVVYTNKQPALYLNGVLIQTGLTSSRTFVYPSKDLGGSSQYSSYGPYQGLLDEVSIYNRALTPTEIHGIYDAGNGGKCFTASPPLITSQPVSQTNSLGQTASFSVTATGTTPLNYQWNYNGTNILGATNSVLAITNVQIDQAGNYMVQVSNAGGSTNSSIAVLIVNPLLPSYPTPAGIVGWWMGEGDALDSISGSNGVVYSGTTFTAGMVGEAFSFDGGTGCVMNDQTPSLTDIQNTFTIEFWAYPQKGINLPPQDGSGYPGISGQSYAIFPNFGGYDGKAGAGVSLGTNGISVMEHAYNYMASVLSYTNAINGWVHVAVVYTNKQPALYLNGVLVQTGLTSSRTFVYPSKDLGGSSQYSSYGPYQGLLDEVSIYNRALSPTEIQGIYNAGNGGKSSTVSPPLIMNQPASQTNSLGQTASFSVTATGTTPLNYQWFFNSAPIANATNQILTLTSITTDILGAYSVVVSNIYGSATSSIANLIMYPYFVTDFMGVITNWGASATLQATAWGSGPLSYQWYQNGVALPDGTNQNLELPNLGFAQGGVYTVVVSSPFGSVTNTPRMVVVNPTPPYLEVTVNLHCLIQNETNINGEVATIAQPVQQKLNAGDILNILAHDEFVKGNWISNSFPKNATLELLNDSFFVLDGTNILLNVSDLLAYETGEPTVVSGKQNVLTRLANHSLRKSQLASIVFDDTTVAGGYKLTFYLYGILNGTTENTTPNNGNYFETQTLKISALIGDGYIGNAPLMITGSLTASGKAPLQIAE